LGSVAEIMKTQKLSLAATITTALACAAAVKPLVLPARVAAQSNPTMTDVVPYGGNYATQGKIQAVDSGALTLTIVPDSSPRCR
jgi:hypothetical protein